MNTEKKKIRDFIVNNFLFGEAGSLQDDTLLMECGIIDSTGILELVLFLETTYSIKIHTEEMLPENLDSINRVARFIAKKSEQPAHRVQRDEDLACSTRTTF